MPIRARIDMLATGIRTPIGIKVFGKDLAEIERVAKEVESVVKKVPGTTSAYAERLTGGYYIDIEPDRMALARYGLAVGDLQDVISTALGGEMVTTTVEGLERYGVVVRYPRDFRSDPQAIATQVLVPVMGVSRPAADGRCSANPEQHDAAARATGESEAGQGPAQHPHRKRVARGLHLRRHPRPGHRRLCRRRADRRCATTSSSQPGYYVTWSGQFEYMERAKEKLKIVVPLTILIIFVLLYLNFGRLTETLIVMLSVPFSLVGGVWLMYLLGYNLSVAVAVGFIALLASRPRPAS